jgi:hypothetical protein
VALQFALKSLHLPIELALAAESREILAQVRGGKPPKVPPAAPAGPLSKDRQYKYFAFAHQDRPTGLSWSYGAWLLPVVHEDVQGNGEEGLRIDV